MHLAYTIAAHRGETNRTLSDVVETLAARGWRLCGTVQTDTPRRKDHHCDMDVKVLPQGPDIRISQDLGPGAKGCRLDPDALERAVHLTMQALDHGADLLVVNKFGKHEAEGRGFRDVIAEALSRDIPVLVGVNDLNTAAFLEFSSDGLQLAPDPLSILAWAEGLTRSAPAEARALSGV